MSQAKISSGIASNEFCGDHREVGMVNVKTKTCELRGRRPNCAMPGGNARFCGEHREVGMVNVSNKTCELCDKQPNPDSSGMPKVGCLSHSSHILFETFTMQTS
jgi:hypothetical protein